MEATIYNVQGKKAGTIALPEKVFGEKWNDSLIHQVVTSMVDNARTPVAHVKDRGEVRGGGKKPWQQKGTGRARVGSSRSPIWKGGGVTHGPRKEKQFARAIPAKMRSKALMVALSRKWKDGQIIFVDSLGLIEPKTAAAVKALVAVGKASDAAIMSDKGPKNKALIAFSDLTPAAKKSLRNVTSIEAKAVRDLNPVAVLKYKYLVIENPAASIAILEARLGAAKSTKAEAKSTK
jgi:large subunit ribosomal protein L4